MKDLRELMDRAAGEPVALTDTELREFARHGRKAVRLRRGLGLAAVSAATAGVVAAAWLVAPGGPQAEPDAAGQGASATATATVTPSPTRPVVPTVDRRITPPARPAKPVPLVAKTVSSREAGVACSLSPKGWTSTGSTLRLRDPRHWRDHESFDHIDVRRTEFAVEANGEKHVPKFSMSWDEFPHYQAGPYQAVVNNAPPTARVPLTAGGERDIFLKVGENALIQVWTLAPRLGWDLRTALRFAGSCRLIN